MARQLVSFDWAMKRILRQKANFEILEGFLSELFKFDVKIEEILESEANQEEESDKFNRVDLLAKNSSGELVLIELQHNSEIDYFQRMLYGTSKLICEHLKKGKDYREVKKVYSVNILYFDLGQGFDYLYYGKTEFRGMNRSDDILQLSTNQLEEFDKNSVYELFPEYYIIKVNRFDKLSKYSTIDEWIHFLKNEEIDDSFRARGLNRAKEELDFMKLSEDEKVKYRRREENKMIQFSVIDTAKIEGRAEGRVEGRNEKAIEIAKMLLLSGDSLEKVSKVTGLTVKEIEQLKELN
jgi:predicted transposase/invertase (TIGR01784 family)